MILKTTTVFLFFISFVTCSWSQDASIRSFQAESLRTIKKDIPDSSHKYWKKGAIYTIGIGGSLSNWAAGGDDFSLSVATSLHLFTFYKKEKTSWDNSLNLNFGYIKTTSLGGRKNDDRIDIVSKYGYALNSNSILPPYLISEPSY